MKKMNDKKLEKGTSNAEVEEKITNLSHLKLQLKNVISSLKELEEVEQGTKNLTQNELRAITQETNALLQQLEQAPMQKFVKILNRRRKKRKVVNKNRLKRHSEKAKIDLAVPNLAQLSSRTAVTGSATHIQPHIVPTANVAANSTQKPHQQLLNYHDAQRALRSLELLKMLHLARTQNSAETRKFASQFEQLRAIWNSVLQENAPQRTLEHKIEDQWNEVFFGAREQTFYGQELKMNDFLRIRRTWDSYLTNTSSHGSSIPLAWVLPTEGANALWTQYSSK